MGADACAQLLGLHRLGHVIDAAYTKAAYDMFALRQRSHEDDGQMLVASVLLDPHACFEAVHVGHHRVEQHHVGCHAREAFERILAGQRDDHHVAARLQRVGKKGEVLRRVVDDQDHGPFAQPRGRVAGDRGGRDRGVRVTRSRRARVGQVHARVPLAENVPPTSATRRFDPAIRAGPRGQRRALRSRPVRSRLRDAHADVR